MIQDIGNHHFDLHYVLCAPKTEDVVYLFRGREILLHTNGALPCYGDLKDAPGLQFIRLFSMDARPGYLALPERDLPELSGDFSYVSYRDYRYHQTMDRVLACYTAMHLNGWYRSNRFCGRCGHPMRLGQKERSLVCPHCGNLVFPRLNPAVIVAVTDGERLLMTKYSGRTHQVHHFVLVAGFVEIGETAEQCVAREVMEETGIHVKNIRYYGSQPWGCDGNLTLGYFADLDGDAHITLDDWELSDAHWFERQNVPVPENDLASITADMIRAFAEGREPR